MFRMIEHLLAGFDAGALDEADLAIELHDHEIANRAYRGNPVYPR
jgi:hypothetical protein